MKFEFAATVILQIRGEAEGIADDLAVVSHPQVTIIPTVIHMPPKALKDLPDHEIDRIMRQLTHHCVHRAEILMRPKDGFTHTEPLPIPKLGPGEKGN